MCHGKLMPQFITIISYSTNFCHSIIKLLNIVGKTKLLTPIIQLLHTIKLQYFNSAHLVSIQTFPSNSTEVGCSWHQAEAVNVQWCILSQWRKLLWGLLSVNKIFPSENRVHLFTKRGCDFTVTHLSANLERKWPENVIFIFDSPQHLHLAALTTGCTARLDQNPGPTYS